MWFLALTGCNPTAPADRWLAALSRGDDEAAFDGLELFGEAPPGGFDLYRFRRRVDRMPGLRAAEVTWDEPRGRFPFTSLSGTYPFDGREVPLTLVVGSDRRIGRVEVDGVPLVPHQTYVVIPDRTPEEAWVAPELVAHPTARGLVVSGVAPPGTLTVEARCLDGERWVADAMVLPVDGAYTTTLRELPPGDPCALSLRWADATRRLRATACAAGGVTRDGPCDRVPSPDPSRPPVTLSEVTAEWLGSTGLSVGYHLRADVPQPAHGAFESAVLTTTVTCPGGVRPVTHTRPLTADWLEPGVERALGSAMKVHAQGRPCALALDYTRDDHYDRVELPLFHGCLAADGGVSPDPCH